MEYRQNQWETNGTSSDDNAEKEKARGNIGLPFGLCEKYGIRLPQNATPSDAWDALEKKGVYPPWTDKGKASGMYKAGEKAKEPPKEETKTENKSTTSEEVKKTAYDVIENKEEKARIHGEFIVAKPYSLREAWVNQSKRGYGYYFSIDVNGKRYFISIDYKTANGRRWYDPLDGYKAMKISANGYVYVDKKGYANFVIKDLMNFARVYD